MVLPRAGSAKWYSDAMSGFGLSSSQLQQLSPQCGCHLSPYLGVTARVDTKVALWCPCGGDSSDRDQHKVNWVNRLRQSGTLTRDSYLRQLQLYTQLCCPCRAACSEDERVAVVHRAGDTVPLPYLLPAPQRLPAAAYCPWAIDRSYGFSCIACLCSAL